MSSEETVELYKTTTSQTACCPQLDAWIAIA